MDFVMEVSLETIMPFYRELRSSFEDSNVETQWLHPGGKCSAEHRMEKVLTSPSYPLPNPGLFVDMDSEARKVAYFSQAYSAETCAVLGKLLILPNPRFPHL